MAKGEKQMGKTRQISKETSKEIKWVTMHRVLGTKRQLVSKLNLHCIEGEKNTTQHIALHNIVLH